MNRNKDFLLTIVIEVSAIKVIMCIQREIPMPGSLKPASTYSFIKKETPAQVFSCELCKISKNIFFYRTPLQWLLLYILN